MAAAEGLADVDMATIAVGESIEVTIVTETRYDEGNEFGPK